ncbi:hypothetical protein ACFVGY_14190 [Streptomyces sp. NPDC127106]|uniref:hypothetical protein n=1 Tax=Streptomyces sp. NPDC127106 TaxID=3345360 RepID=UPI003635874E
MSTYTNPATTDRRIGTELPAPAARLRRALGRVTRTPAVLYDTDGIDAEIAAFRRALGLLDAPRTRLLFSVKANRAPALLGHLAGRGLGAAVAGVGEDRAAREAGLGPRWATGPGLGPEELAQLHAHGTHLDIDGVEQLAAVPRGSEVGLRVAVPIPAESTARGIPWSRFGLRWNDPAERGAVLEVLRERALRPVRLHAHVRDVGGVADVRPLGRVLAEAARDLPDVTEVNIGGGMIRLFHHNPDEVPAVFACLAEGLASAGRPLGVLAEPGAQIVTSHGYLVTRVRSVYRAGGRQSVTVDASAWNLAGWSRFSLVPLGPSRAQRWTTDVAGPTCYEKDLWFTGAATDRIEPEDLVVLRGAGAYVTSMHRVLHDLPAPVEELLPPAADPGPAPGAGRPAADGRQAR